MTDTMTNKVLRVRQVVEHPFEDTELSKQEKAAMTLVLEGKPDLIIATEMGLALGTVKQFIFRARNKLGISRPELGWWVLGKIRDALDGTE